MIPIGRAALRAEHTVAFAGQAAMVPLIEAVGFTAIPTAGATLRTKPELLPLLELDSAREDRDLREGFATRLARQHASDILSLYNEWQPDLLVCDEVDFGTVIAAEGLMIPYATVLVIASILYSERDHSSSQYLKFVKDSVLGCFGMKFVISGLDQFQVELAGLELLFVPFHVLMA